MLGRILLLLSGAAAEPAQAPARHFCSLKTSTQEQRGFAEDIQEEVRGLWWLITNVCEAMIAADDVDLDSFVDSGVGTQSPTLASSVLYDLESSLVEQVRGSECQRS